MDRVDRMIGQLVTVMVGYSWLVNGYSWLVVVSYSWLVSD